MAQSVRANTANVKPLKLRPLVSPSLNFHPEELAAHRGLKLRKGALNLRAQRTPKTDTNPPTKATGKVIPMRGASPMHSSPLPPAESSKYSEALRMSTIYLQSCLPQGSRNLFTPRRYGNYLGVPVVCPHCEKRPPHEIRPWNRWRWLTFHIATQHTKGRD